MPRRIKLAIVGCGAVSQMDYFPALEQPHVQERVELVAVCDVVAERARSVGERAGAREIWSDYERMLASTEAEALVLLTPIPYHYQQGLAAVAAGKHVYIQKTMTASYAQARELIEQAEKQSIVLAAAPGQMLNPAHQAARDVLASGVVGKPCFARGMGSHPGHENSDSFGTDQSWYYRPGGGPVMDVAVYPLHSLTGLLGPVRRVTALSGIALRNRSWQGKPIDVQMDDNTLLLLDFGDSVFAEVNGTYCQRAWGMNQIEIYAERGVVNLGGWTRGDMPLEVYAEFETPGGGRRWDWYRPEGLTPTMMHTVADMLHFAECVGDGKKPINSAAHAAHVIEIIEKGYLAAKTGEARALESSF